MNYFPLKGQHSQRQPAGDIEEGEQEPQVPAGRAEPSSGTNNYQAGGARERKVLGVL